MLASITPNNTIFINTNNNKTNSIQLKRHNNKKVSFTGEYYPSGYYTDKEIVDTYKYLNHPESSWEQTAKSELMDRYGFFKYVFGGGAEELERHLKEMAKLRKDLLNQRKQIELEKKKKEELEKQLEKERIRDAKLQGAKDQLKSGFLDLITLSKKDEDVQIPNGIMVESSDNGLSKDLISWVLDQPDYEKAYVRVNTGENSTNLSKIREQLLKSKETFEKTGERTLLFIDDFELMTSQKDENKGAIATLKSAMFSCSDKYKCTIILTAPKSNNIDPVLLVDSRVPLKISINDDQK